MSTPVKEETLEQPAETKRINGRFQTPVAVGDLVVNADRATSLIPRYRVASLTLSSARLEGVDRALNFVVRLKSNARHVFKKID